MRLCSVSCRLWYLVRVRERTGLGLTLLIALGHECISLCSQQVPLRKRFVLQHTSAYVSIRQQVPLLKRFVLQHTSAYVYPLLKRFVTLCCRHLTLRDERVAQARRVSRELV